jgi:tetratricopeptide (TPR) repeat protein
VRSDGELDRAKRLIREGNAEEAEALVDHVLEADGGANRREVLFVKAVAASAQGRTEQALEVLDEVLAEPCPSDLTTAKALELKARLVGPSEPSAAPLLRNALIDQFGGVSTGPINDLVALSLLENARWLDGTGHPAEALRLLERLKDRVGNVGDTALRRRPHLVAEAAYLRAVALTEVRRSDDARRALANFVGRYDAPDVSVAVRRMVARALLLLAGLSRASDDLMATSTMLESVIERFEEADDPSLQDSATQAIKLRAAVLDDRRDDGAAIGAWTALVDRVSGGTPAEDPAVLAEALYRRGVVSLRRGHLEDAAADFDAVGRTTGPSSWRTMALVASAELLIRRGRTSDAYLTVARLADDLDDDEAGAAVSAVDSAVGSLSAAGAEQGDGMNGALLRALITGLEHAAGPAPRGAAAMAQLQLSFELGRRGHPREAINAYNSVFDFGEDALPAWDLAIRRAERSAFDAPEHLAQAMLGRAVTLRAAGRQADADDAFRQIVDRFGKHTSAPVELVVAAARQAGGDLRR